MTKIETSPKTSTDDMYYVSAGDLADKIINHMWRDVDPLQLSSSSLAQFSARSFLKGPHYDRIPSNPRKEK
jgi:hypothetical protein